MSGNTFCAIYSSWFGWVEKATHHFSGSVFIQRGADLKALLSSMFITGNVVTASMKELEQL